METSTGPLGKHVMSSRQDPSAPSGRKRNVGFIELPDEALDVFSHYTQLPDWDVVLVVSQVYDSYAVRMAEILQVPVLDAANRLSLLSCDRVIVGQRPMSLLATVREILEETPVEVVPVVDALRDLGISDMPASPRSEKPGDAERFTAPLDDGIWTDPEPAEASAQPAPDPGVDVNSTVEAGHGVDKVEAGAEVEPDAGGWASNRWPGAVDEITFIPRRDPVKADPEADPTEVVATDRPMGDPPAEDDPAETLGSTETADTAPAFNPVSAEVAEVDLSDPEVEDDAAADRPVEEDLADDGPADALAANRPAEETSDDDGPVRKRDSRQWTPRMVIPSGEARRSVDSTAVAASAEPAAEAPSGPAFDAGTLLGADLRERLGALALDENEDRLLREILQLAVRATHGQSGSIMLLDEDGENLRIAEAQGLSTEVVANTRRKVGKGVAGQVFASGTARIVRGHAPESVDHVEGRAYRESASVPILSDGRPIGVLNVNVDSEGFTLDDKALSLLTRFAKEASGAILKALDLRRLDGAQRQEALQRQVDRLMALQESLPSRIHAVGDALGAALAADFVHFFVVDPLGRRLELLTPPRGTAVWHPKSQPLDKGFLGWAVREGTPRLLGVAEDGREERAAMICLPIQSTRPHALVVLENVPLAGTSPEKIMDLLTRLVEHVEEIIGVEEGVDAQELLYQLKMRVSDQSPQLLPLPPVLRTRAALELAVQLLAGEAAIWVPPHGARPVTSEPHTARSANLLAEARASLDLLSELVQDRGAVAGGSDAAGWDAKAPRGPAPYVGVSASGDAEGVLLLFFSPDETVGSPAQVPAQVLLEVLVKISEVCSAGGGEDIATAPEPAGGNPVVPNPRTAMGSKELEALVHQEWLRSRRYGHAFALTRFRLRTGGNEDPVDLRDFILREKRDVDLVAEARSGTYVVLSPEVDRNPDGISRRLSEKWRRRAGAEPLDVDQRVFPRDGHAERTYQAWLRGEEASGRAA